MPWEEVAVPTSLNVVYHPSKSTTQPSYATRRPLGLKGYEDADERQ